MAFCYNKSDTLAEMTKELDWNQGDFSINLKPVEISKSQITIICTSSKVARFAKLGECGSKIMLTTPIWILKCFWREIHFYYS